MTFGTIRGRPSAATGPPSSRAVGRLPGGVLFRRVRKLHHAPFALGPLDGIEDHLREADALVDEHIEVLVQLGQE